METKQDHYNIGELINKWNNFPISKEIKNLLDLGAQGLIQYSIDPKKMIQNAPTASINTSWHYVSGGKMLQCDHSSDLLSAKYLKLTKQTIFDLSIEPNTKSTVDLHPWCQYCPYGRSPENCLVVYELQYNQEFLEQLEEWENNKLENKVCCEINDLVVTHVEVTRFENQFYDSLNPPYLDPEHLCFCKELAVCVETWREIFEYKSIPPEKTCKMTAETFIRNNHPEFSGDTDRGTGALGRLAVMLNTVPDERWKHFIKINF